jgi:hypothetical protein
VQGIGSYATHRTAPTTATTTAATATTYYTPVLYTAQILQQLTDAPNIVHYTGKAAVTLAELGNRYCTAALKPWTGVCSSSGTASTSSTGSSSGNISDGSARWLREWYAVLDAKPFAGWRPNKVCDASHTVVYRNAYICFQLAVTAKERV